MIEAGLNIARLNLAHGQHDEHRELVRTVREVAGEIGAPVAVMADTPGRGMRVGTLKQESVRLEAGQRILLTEESVIGDERRIYVDRTGFSERIRPGMEILLSGGEILLEAEETRPSEVVCRVKNSGLLGERKRVHVPEEDFPSVAGDEESVGFAAELDVDYVAASFVEGGRDILRVREFLGDRRDDIGVIAKIETRAAVENIDGLIEAADGIMVARGDMGVELPVEEVPLVQKQIVTKCNRMGVPVIIATQMLKSMTENPTPTRAEVTDVANAVLDGTDALMLSEETAIGNYPVEAVQAMSKIAERTERDAEVYHRYPLEHTSVTEAIGESACEIAERIKARAIIPSTTSGSTAKLVAKFRPRIPIVAVTTSEKVQHKLALVWGIYPLRIEFQDETDAMLRRSIEVASQVVELPRGASVVLTAGVPFGVPGTTNLIKVEQV